MMFLNRVRFISSSHRYVMLLMNFFPEKKHRVGWKPVKYFARLNNAGFELILDMGICFIHTDILLEVG